MLSSVDSKIFLKVLSTVDKIAKLESFANAFGEIFAREIFARTKIRETFQIFRELIFTIEKFKKFRMGKFRDCEISEN